MTLLPNSVELINGVAHRFASECGPLNYAGPLVRATDQRIKKYCEKCFPSDKKEVSNGNH